MKQLFYCIVLLSGIGFTMAACSNGDYDANPSSNANNTLNPLTPLDSAAFSAYLATARAPMSASINGAGWTVDSSSAGWVLDSTGTNIIIGKGGGQYIALYLKNVYAVNIYSMGFKNTVTYGTYAVVDSAHPYSIATAYLSYAGNSGEVQILENDANVIEGLFYFQGVNSTNDVVNVTNGYFNINKH